MVPHWEMMRSALVRKKLKWSDIPFEIPQEILDAWQKIGAEGEQLEKNWQESS